MLILLIRGIALLGCLLCVAAALLYKHEETSLQSRLEEWWIRFDDAATRGMGRLETFIGSVSRSVTSLLDQLLTPEIFSERSVLIVFLLGVSLETLVTSIQIWTTQPAVIRGDEMAATVLEIAPYTVSAWSLVYVALLSLYVRYGHSKRWIIVLARVAFVHYLTVSIVVHAVYFDVEQVVSVMLAWASALSLYWAIRVLLRQTAEVNVPKGRFRYHKSCAVLVLFLASGGLGLMASWSLTRSPVVMWVIEVSQHAVLLNAVNIVLVAAIIMAAGGLLAYRITWQFLSRLFYQLPGRQVISSHKALWATAFTLGSFAWLGPELVLREGSGCQWNATLMGTVHPNDAWTSAWFEWGETPALGRVTAAQIFRGSRTEVPYEQTVFLAQGKTYFYRAVVVNAYGRAEGELDQFETGLCTGPTER